MIHPHTKNKLLLIESMFAIMVLIFVAAFALDRFYPTGAVNSQSNAPGIVGFVPVEIKSQPIDIFAKEPTSFVLFTDKTEQFELTSLRLTGEVTGNGRAEIVLDNGLGQELLIYSNVKHKQGNLITGMAVTSDESEPLPEGAKIEKVAGGQEWLKISASEDHLNEAPTKELGDSMKAEAGAFQHSCVDTCYINMKLQKGLYYTIKVRVDAGTELRINELKYMLEV